MTLFYAGLILGALLGIALTSLAVRHLDRCYPQYPTKPPLRSVLVIDSTARDAGQMLFDEIAHELELARDGVLVTHDHYNRGRTT